MTVQVHIDPATGLTKSGNSIEREKSIQLLFSTQYNSGVQGWGLGIPNVLRNADQLLMCNLTSKKDHFMEASYFPHAYWSVDNRPVGTKQIVDSGSFALMYGAGAKVLNECGIEYGIDKYLEMYIEFVNNHFKTRCKTANTPWFVEMDLSPLIGMEKYRKVRDKLLASCPDRDLIGVWHQEDGIKGLEEVCEHFDYVSISAAMTWKIPAMNALYYLADKYPEKPVHILGRSTMDAFREKGYHKLADTCDSTTWVMPKRFGCDDENKKILGAKIQTLLEDNLLKYIPFASKDPTAKYGWTKTNRDAEMWVLFKVWEMWNEFSLAGHQKQWDKGHIREVIRKALSGEVDSITEADLGEFLWEPSYAPLSYIKKNGEETRFDWYVPKGYENIVNNTLYEVRPLMM